MLNETRDEWEGKRKTFLFPSNNLGLTGLIKTHVFIIFHQFCACTASHSDNCVKKLLLKTMKKRKKVCNKEKNI